MQSTKPILLTGSHRSGTTWAANMLAAAPDLGFIMEPFNDANNRFGIFNAKFGCFFPYINHENESEFLPAANKTISFQYELSAGIRSAKSFREYARILKDLYQSSQNRALRKRPFVKDPNALFMVEWLVKRFGMDVVILIRHPAAFISSLKILDWGFPFSSLTDQPLLIRDYLSQFESEIATYARKEHDILDQGILIWKILHYVISQYQKKYSDWHFVRHEDLSIDPERQFKDLFESLGLSFTHRAHERLRKYTGVSNESDTTSRDVALNSRKSISRHSKKNIWNWKQRLSEDEVKYIRERVESISSLYYSDKDW